MINNFEYFLCNNDLMRCLLVAYPLQFHYIIR
jgi:hypothetical protein